MITGPFDRVASTDLSAIPLIPKTPRLLSISCPAVLTPPVPPTVWSAAPLTTRPAESTVPWAGEPIVPGGGTEFACAPTAPPVFGATPAIGWRPFGFVLLSVGKLPSAPAGTGGGGGAASACMVA